MDSEDPLDASAEVDERSETFGGAHMTQTSNVIITFREKSTSIYYFCTHIWKPGRMV